MEMSLISHSLPNVYVLNGVGLTIKINENDCLNEDCLNPMMLSQFVTSVCDVR